MSRTAVRRFAAALALVAGFAATGCTPLLRWRHSATPDLHGEVVAGELLVPVLHLPWHMGGPLWVIVGAPEPPGKLLLLRTSGNELVAVAAACPHDACDMGLLQHQDVILCPCDGSRYATDGRVLSGPARAPLVLLPVRLAGAHVAIRLRE